jgi:branched-chain amino acid transport system ATP-binding protein
MLEIRDLHAGYATASVLHGTTLSVGTGRVVALLGRNGMGQTTLLRAVCGLRPPHVTRGAIRFDEHDLGARASHEVARLGLSLVPQGRRVFRSLSVAENLRVAARPAEGGWSLERVFELFPRLAERPRQAAATLSGGEQQMLAIGRSLMTNPRLLLMDEPSEEARARRRSGGPHRGAERRPRALGRGPRGRAGRIGHDHLVRRPGDAARGRRVAPGADGRLTSEGGG